MNQDTLILRVGDLKLQAVGRRATFRGDRVDLTPRQFDLMATLMRQPERTFTCRELLGEVWHGTAGNDRESAVRMTVKRIRDEFLDPVFLVSRDGGYAVTAACPKDVEDEIALGPWDTRAKMRAGLNLEGTVTRPITVIFPATLKQAEHERWIRAIASALATRHNVTNPRHVIASTQRLMDLTRQSGVSIRATVRRSTMAVAA